MFPILVFFASSSCLVSARLVLTCHTSTCPGSVANCQCEGVEGALEWTVNSLDTPALQIFRITYSVNNQSPSPQPNANGYSAILSGVDMSGPRPILSSTLSITLSQEECESNVAINSTALQMASK